MYIWWYKQTLPYYSRFCSSENTIVQHKRSRFFLFSTLLGFRSRLRPSPHADGMVWWYGGTIPYCGGTTRLGPHSRWYTTTTILFGGGLLMGHPSLANTTTIWKKNDMVTGTDPPMPLWHQRSTTIFLWKKKPLPNGPTLRSAMNHHYPMK